MQARMRWVAGVVVTALAVTVFSPSAVAQTDPPETATTSTTRPAGPTPSLPPGLPTVAPPTVPSTDPNAPPPEPEPPLPDPSPEVAVVMAKLNVVNAQRVLDLTTVAWMTSVETEQKVQHAHDLAQHDYDQKRALLTDAVANAYVRGTDVSGTSPSTIDEYMPQASARLLVATAIEHDQAQVRDADQRLQRAQTLRAPASARSSQTGVAHDFAQAAYAGAVDDVRKAGRLRNSRDVSPSVLGDAVLTPDELVGWYRSEGIVGYVAGVDVQTLAGFYVDESKSEQVRGDVAFAQSIVETGAFTSPLTTHNNYAGIGACDTCPTGFEFPSPLMGVRAQAQLLHAYADRTVRTRTLANPAIGSDPDTLSVRGCCTTWNALTGTWASDPNYGPKIMTVYLSMLQYALVARTNASTG